MSNEDKDREFRIRPRRPRRPRTDEPRVWSSAFGQMMHFARMSSHRRVNKSGGLISGSAAASRHFMQRCAVRVTYSANRTPGQWAAHARYLARESATLSESGKGSGFERQGEVRDMDTTLAD